MSSLAEIVHALSPLDCSPVDTRSSLLEPALEPAEPSTEPGPYWLTMSSGECIKVIVVLESGEYRAYEDDWDQGFPVGRGATPYAAYLDLKGVLENS